MYTYLYRWNVQIDHEARTLQSLHMCLADPKNKKGCINAPLLNIPINDIVIDEMHLMLRIFDILLRNVIWAMIHQDLIERHNSRPAIYLDQLVKEIKSCGVTFKVHQNI